MWMDWSLRSPGLTPTERAYLATAALLIKIPRVCQWPICGRHRIKTNEGRLWNSRLWLDDRGSEWSRCCFKCTCTQCEPWSSGCVVCRSSRFGVSGESRCGTATSRVTGSVLSIRIPARPAGEGGGGREGWWWGGGGREEGLCSEFLDFSTSSTAYGHLATNHTLKLLLIQLNSGH